MNNENVTVPSMESIDGLSKGPEGILGRQDLAWLAIGQVIGAGVIALIGPSMEATGTSVWLAYFVAIIFGIFLVFPFYVLSGSMRLSGGEYSVAYSILGKKIGGFYLIGKIPAMIALGSYPIAASGYIASLVPGINEKFLAIGILTLFYIVNLAGVGFMSKIQNILGYLLMAGLLAFVIFGLPKVNWSQISISSPEFMPNGLKGFFTAVFILIFSTHGYYWVIGYSNVAKNSRVDVPFAIKCAIPVITVLYVGCGIIASGVLPLSEVAGKPLTYVAKEALPTVIFWLFYLGGAMGALLTSLNSTFGFYANMFAGGANDGWLPEIFAKQNKNGAYWVVLTLGFIIGLLPIIFGFSVDAVTSNTMFVNAIMMFVSFAAAWQLPKKYPGLWSRSTVRLPMALFRVMMILSFIMEFVVIVYSAMGSNTFAVIISAAAILISILYAHLRFKTGKVTSNASIWYD